MRSLISDGLNSYKQILGFTFSVLREIYFISPAISLGPEMKVNFTFLLPTSR